MPNTSVLSQQAVIQDTWGILIRGGKEEKNILMCCYTTVYYYLLKRLLVCAATALLFIKKEYFYVVLLFIKKTFRVCFDTFFILKRIFVCDLWWYNLISLLYVFLSFSLCKWLCVCFNTILIVITIIFYLIKTIRMCCYYYFAFYKKDNLHMLCTVLILYIIYLIF